MKQFQARHKGAYLNISFIQWIRFLIIVYVEFDYVG
jgi:hypothetical protein